MRVIERPAVNFPPRVFWALGIVLAWFFVLLIRLWYLQVIKGDYFRVQSENNRIRTVFVPPPRGLLYDRNGKLLVSNRPAFNVELVEADAQRPKESVAKLAEILGYKPEALFEALKNQRKRRLYEPKLILSDISRDTVAKVMSRLNSLPGIVISMTSARNYLYGSFAAHAIGYIREVTERQLSLPKFAGYYRQGDLVGQDGIESHWERILQGRRGSKRVIVNAVGTRMGESSTTREIAGGNLTLTLDYDIQRAADESLLGKRGAVIALVPDTGEILAISSSPAFDPNSFASGVSVQLWRSLISDRTKPLMNRALRGGFPPGSVWKIFMSVAAMTEGVMRPGERVTCGGSFTFGNHVYGCWKKAGHGSLNLHEALVQSCDVYYYTAGNRLGVDRIHDYASMFGFGERTGFDPNELSGLVPSTEWKRKAFKRPDQQKWYPGETPSVAIGQGAVVVTPMQIARAVSILLNGGKAIVPYIVKAWESSDGINREPDAGPDQAKFKQVELEPKVVKFVKESMLGVVNEPTGTGGKAKLGPEFPGVSVGGKTGTAQPRAGEGKEDHAWFAGFAETDKPEIVAVALVESGGHGGSAAAPLVKNVFEAYFTKKMAKAEGVEFDVVRERLAAVRKNLPKPPAQRPPIDNGQDSHVD